MAADPDQEKLLRGIADAGQRYSGGQSGSDSPLDAGLKRGGGEKKDLVAKALEELRGIIPRLSDAGGIGVRKGLDPSEEFFVGAIT
jgi:hypothetical protein